MTREQALSEIRKWYREATVDGESADHLAKRLNAELDQDWEGERTVFRFTDGFAVECCGSDVELIEGGAA